MRKILLFLTFLFAGAFLVGCFQPKNVVTSIEVVSDTTEFDESFQLTDLNVKVNMSDGSSSLVPLNESMLSTEDLAKFSTEGTHTINVSYLNMAAAFTITITGEAGADGREIEVQVAGGYIQWRYEGDATWTNLIALSSLMGAAGTNGTNGRQVAFRIDSGYIQWQYVGDATWTNLLALTVITGPAGTNGSNGTNGTDGVTPTIAINQDGYWVINGTVTAYKASGTSETPAFYTVTYEVNGGVLPQGVLAVLADVPECTTLTLPIPTKDGYAFQGWWTGETVNDGQFSKTTPVTKNVTLYARWILDTAPIQELMNATQSRNYTAQMDISIDFTMGLQSGRFEILSDFQINETDGIVFTYNVDSEKSFPNGV